MEVIMNKLYTTKSRRGLFLSILTAFAVVAPTVVSASEGTPVPVAPSKWKPAGDNLLIIASNILSVVPEATTLVTHDFKVGSEAVTKMKIVPAALVLYGLWKFAPQVKRLASGIWNRMCAWCTGARRVYHRRFGSEEVIKRRDN